MTEKNRLTMSSDAVGTTMELGERQVEWRSTCNYAACVGDLNPRYLDDTQGKRVMAPPMFVVAFTWPLLSGSTADTLRNALPEEVLQRGVNASEHLLFHRPIRAGDRLAVCGRLISVQPTSAGVCSVVRLDLLDATYGAVVATQYTTTLYRGVACSDQGRALEEVPHAPLPGSWDDPLSEISIPIDRALPYLYDGCTGVTFPIHISPGFATERAGLPDIVLQGTCSLSLVAREIVNREAGGHPERLADLACRFSRLVVPGTTVRLQLALREENRGSRQITFRLLNADGEEALSRGCARITR